MVVPSLATAALPQAGGTTVILGGGLSGLCSAFYLSRLYNQQQHQASSSAAKRKIVLLEKSDRFGGWVQSCTATSSSSSFTASSSSSSGLKGKEREVVREEVEFEAGPRSVRPVGLPGLLTLDLIHELGLEESLVTVDKSHPSAKNRYIFYNGKLHIAPSSLASAITSSFSSSSPFHGLLPSVLSEPFKAKRRPSPTPSSDDESVDSFVSRRFRKSIAENVLSALVHGIYAGDTRQLSIRSVFPSLWEAERLKGSIVRSMLFGGGMKLPDWEAEKKKEIEGRLPELTGRMKDVSVYSLKGGLEELPKGLVRHLGGQSNVELRERSGIESLSFQSGRFKLRTTGESSDLEADTVVSALSATNLFYLTPDLPHLAHNPSVTVGVVNLAFPSTFSLPMKGFGYLIPRSVSRSDNPHYALGVVFDSDMFSQPGMAQDTPREPVRLTVMMGGHYWEDGASVPSKQELLNGALETLDRHGVVPKDVEPIASRVHVQKDCIPQYLVGHPGRMKELHQALMTQYNGRLGVVGSSYNGVGMNDCVKSSWAHARHLAQTGRSTGLEMWAA